LSQTNSPELHVGSNVYTIDGEKIGRLRFLMVDPDTASVSHLVLEKSSYVNADVMVPTDRVGQVLNRGIYLTANLGEIIDMEEFPEAAYTGQRGERPERGERQDGERGDRQGGNRGDRGNSERGNSERAGADRNNSDRGSNGNRRNKRYRRHRD
jgi:sporulation protein YlmC with PRC-barrel domain